MCFQKTFCIKYYVSFTLFAGNLSKDERGSFWARNAEKYHLRSLWGSVVPVTVRRWHRSEAAEGRWGSLTKFGVTKCMINRRIYDSPSCWFVVMIREVVQYPNSRKFKCYGTETLDGPSCLERSVIPAIEGNEERNRRICKVMADGVHDDPS